MLKIFDIKDGKMGYYCVPKCGSRTILAWRLLISDPALLKNYPDWFAESPRYMRYKELNSRSISTEQNDFPVRFCVVRDPVDRFLSAFTNRILFHELSPSISIDDVIGNFEEIISDREYRDFRDHIFPLSKHLGTDPNFYTHIFNLKDLRNVKTLMEEIYGVKLPDLHLQQNGGIQKPVITETQKKFIMEKYKSDYEVYGRWL